MALVAFRFYQIILTRLVEGAMLGKQTIIEGMRLTAEGFGGF